jgi:hypothetical protein
VTAAGTAPDRPAVATPVRRDAVERRQPGLGAAGLLLVAPVAWLLGFAAGPEDSLRVLGPLVAFALPAIVMIAFWWENWPGTRLRASWSGWADTLAIAVLAVALTGLGQAVVGTVDLRAIFDPTPATAGTATFPDTMPLAGAVFVVMLQLTFACEGWPLRGRLPPVPAGTAALAVSWLVAVALWAVLPDLGALPVLIGVWQVWIYVVWRGWPFSEIDRRAVRLPVANAVVLAGGGLTFALAHAAGAGDARITAVAGSLVAAALLVGMLFEDWLGRAATLVAILAVGAVLEPALQAYAAGAGLTPPAADEWVTHASLNAIGVAVILHVAVGRRWPLAAAV